MEDLSPEEELLSRHHGEEATSMEKNLGALPRPGRVPEQELLVPRSLLAMAEEIGIASGKRRLDFHGFLDESKNKGQRGAPGVAPLVQAAPSGRLG